jgi:dTDP-4-amino-4,6-dideoxygalactose transaminase
MPATFEQIVDAINANEGQVMDDCLQALPAERRKSKAGAIARYGAAVVHLTVNDRSPCTTMGVMYLGEDGIAHISRNMVGPVLCPANHGGLQKAVAHHNLENARGAVGQGRSWDTLAIEQLTYP